MNSDSESESIFSETNSELDELIICMEHQIDSQNTEISNQRLELSDKQKSLAFLITEIKELKKQIENLKSLLISQLPHYLNAVIQYI